jgi:hypothetical protein
VDRHTNPVSSQGKYVLSEGTYTLHVYTAGGGKEYTGLFLLYDVEKSHVNARMPDKI